MLVEPNYRSFRIEVTAQHVDGAWNAEVRICRKPTGKVAEERGLVYARRWVDRHAGRER